MAVVTRPDFDTTYGVYEARLCNRALHRIGGEPITETTDDTKKQVRLCKELYAEARDALLRMFPWNFATRNERIYEVEPDNAVVGFSYVFDLSDLEPLKIIKINNDIGILYDIMQLETSVGFTRCVVCNEYLDEDETLGKYIEVRYTEQVVDTGRFDPVFTEALVLNLAAKLAFPIMQDKDLSARLFNEFTVMLSNARNLSSEERVVDEADDYWTSESNRNIG